MDVEAELGRSGEPSDRPTEATVEQLAREMASLRELELRRTELLLGLSQELRDPLAMIVGFGELLASYDYSPQLVRDMAADIQRGAGRLEALIKELVQLIASAPHHIPVDPGVLADEQSGEVERLRELLAEAEQHRAALEAELAEARRAQQQLQSYADDFRRTYAESRQRLQQMTALYEVSTTIGATVDPTEVVDRTAEGLRRLLPRDGTALYLLDEDGQLARRRAASCPAEITPPPEVVAPDQGPVGRCLRAGVPVLEGTGGGDGETGRNADGATSEAEASAGGGAVWSLALPLSAGQQQLGALLLLRSRDEPFADEERHLVEMVASQTAMALQNARLATTDALTGLYNRGYFDKLLAFECERARRVGRPLGLLIIDVDHFKAFNDEYGHPAGDEVLRLAAATLASQLRRTDIVARIGGEEFAAILPENDRDAAAVAAERLRRAVELRPRPRFEGQELPSLRISVGGASLPGDVVAPKRLMQAADEALQQAKRSGRNRSVIAEGPAAEVGS